MEVSEVLPKVKELYECYLNEPWYFEVNDGLHWRTAQYGRGLPESEEFVFPDTIEPNIGWVDELTGQYDDYHNAQCYYDEIETICREAYPLREDASEDEEEQREQDILELLRKVTDECKDWENKLKTLLGV